MKYIVPTLLLLVIALPAWQNRKNESALTKQVETLSQRIEALENGADTSP